MFLLSHQYCEDKESVMCDLIKIRLKGRMRGEVGKKTPKKEIDLEGLL